MSIVAAASRSVRLLTPGDHFLRLLRALTEESGVRGNLIFDAQIAAVCLEHGASMLLKEDRDFARFRKLQRDGLQEILHRSTAIDRRDQHFGWITAASASEPAETVITRSQ